MNLCPFCPPSHTVLDLPQSSTHMQTYRPTVSLLSLTAKQVEAVIRETVFHSDPRKSTVNDKGNREMESDGGSSRLCTV